LRLAPAGIGILSWIFASYSFADISPISPMSPSSTPSGPQSSDFGAQVQKATTAGLQIFTGVSSDHFLKKDADFLDLDSNDPDSQKQFKIDNQGLNEQGDIS